MTKIFKRISAVAMAAAMATTMAVSASARQPYFVDPEVHSGDWNPFTRDRVTAIIYGCDVESHQTSQFDVSNLVVWMKNNDTNDVNTDNYISTSTWAVANTQNKKAKPATRTFTSPWSDGVKLSAKLDCSDGEIWCWDCLDARPINDGYGTGDKSNEIFES